MRYLLGLSVGFNEMEYVCSVEADSIENAAKIMKLPLEKGRWTGCSFILPWGHTEFHFYFHQLFPEITADALQKILNSKYDYYLKQSEESRFKSEGDPFAE